MSRIPRRSETRRACVLAASTLALLVLWLGSPALADTPAPTPTPTPSEGADLRVFATSDAPGRLMAGARFVYTLQVANTGDLPATEVLIVDQLPPGIRVVAADALAKDGRCDVAGAMDSEGHERMTALCRLPSVAAGESATIRVRVAVPRDSGCRTLTNRVTASSADEPAASEDAANRDVVSDVVACSCGIALRTVVTPSRAAPGALVRVTYIVSNTGDGPARVLVRDGRLGNVGVISHLFTGVRRSLYATWQLPLAGGAVTRGSSASAILEDGSRCRAHARATALIDRAAQAPRSPGGTPFTGLPTTPSIAFLLLLGAGLLALRLSRRRADVS